MNHIFKMADAQILTHKEAYKLKTDDNRDTVFEHLLRENLLFDEK